MFSKLIIGKSYKNDEIMHIFKCKNCGGIRKSNKTKSVFIYSDFVRKHPYKDERISDDDFTKTFIYTGCGKKGDQSFEKYENEIIRKHKHDGLRLFYFEKIKEKEYVFKGEIEYVDHYWDVELDENNIARKVIKFIFKRVANYYFEKKLLDSIELCEEDETRKLAIEDLVEEITSCEWGETVELLHVHSIQRLRNSKVKRYTLERAAGICDLCGKEAPFIKEDGTPYLEIHHLEQLSNNGPDAIFNTVAVCPNCHRKLHVLKMRSDYEILRDKITEYLESDPLISPEKRIYLINKHKLLHGCDGKE